MGTNSPEGGDFGHNLTEIRQARRKGAENKKETTEKRNESGKLFLIAAILRQEKGNWNP